MDSRRYRDLSHVLLGLTRMGSLGEALGNQTKEATSVRLSDGPRSHRPWKQGRRRRVIGRDTSSPLDERGRE
jgi:hypothetical protein